MSTSGVPAVASRVKAVVRRQSWLAASVTSTTSPALVVTLDDGPEPDQTPQVLAALEAHGASATFFVLLTRVRRHPEILRAVLAAGHEIGLHGPDHRPLTAFGFREALARTRAAKEELEQAAGRAVRWFRPPYGAQTPATWAAVRAAGLVPVLWDGTTWDWKDVPHAERRRKALESVRPGGILLAHDGIAGPQDGVPDLAAPLADRAGLLAEVLQEAAGRGIAGLSLGGVLRDARAVRTVAFTGLVRTAGGP